MINPAYYAFSTHNVMSFQRRSSCPDGVHICIRCAQPIWACFRNFKFSPIGCKLSENEIINRAFLCHNHVVTFKLWSALQRYILFKCYSYILDDSFIQSFVTTFLAFIFQTSINCRRNHKQIRVCFERNLVA
jgi:hypothetical protein